MQWMLIMVGMKSLRSFAATPPILPTITEALLDAKACRFFVFKVSYSNEAAIHATIASASGDDVGEKLRRSHLLL